MRSATCAELLLLGVILTMSQSGHAVPVKWVLEDVTLLDTFTVEGSFIYDADATDPFLPSLSINSDLNFLISCNAPTTDGCASFGFGIPIAPPSFDAGGFFFGGSALTAFVQADISDNSFVGDILLFLAFAEDLSNRGGVIDIVANLSVLMQCSDLTCAEFDLQTQNFAPVRG